jgi:microcystin degradation protein MlrC
LKNITISILLFSLILNACQEEPKILPRIAIAGLSIESSTFSQALTDSAAFHPRCGQDVFRSYGFLSDNSRMRKRAIWLPALVGKSLPGGAVKYEAYMALTKRLLDSLKKNAPYDGLYFDINGAMSVVGLDDPEADLLKRIRQVVGYKTIISTSMDSHGNVSEALAANTDLITCYRQVPHGDLMETKRSAVETLLQRIESGTGKPAYKAWIPIPILLPAEMTGTSYQPGRSIVTSVARESKQEGITDASIWFGYALADEPRNHAVVMVTGDDKAKVTKTAQRLAKRFWKAREKFHFPATALPWKQALDSALKSSKRPYFISDLGDNPAMGGAGDVSWTLNQLLKDPRFQSDTSPSMIYASIPGPELVARAVKAGVGGRVDGYAGAKIESKFSPPAHIKGIVHSIVNDDIDGRVEAVIRTGNLYIIVTQKRKSFLHENDFTRLDLIPKKTDIVIVKSGYLQQQLYPMNQHWILALTRGGVDQDIGQLPYKRIKRPMFPFDKDMADPDLSARLIPVSGN